MELEELIANWPEAFDTSIVDDFLEMRERAYSMEIVNCKQTGKPELRVSFSYEYDEAYKAFKDAADVMAVFGPSEYTTRVINMNDGCICTIDLQWSEDDDDEDCFD